MLPKITTEQYDYMSWLLFLFLPDTLFLLILSQSSIVNMLFFFNWENVKEKNQLSFKSLSQSP